MLIEFSVSNFRSFRERQTFSMVAAPRLKKKNNTFVPDVQGEKLPNLLKVAAIYGPNASGKSNLIRALSSIFEIAGTKPSASPEKLPVAPFRFDAALRNEPSRFEVHFIANKQRYEFHLAATEDRIVHERLVAYPRGKETLLYDRRYEQTGDVYDFGSNALEGTRELHDTWKSLTAKNILFIHQAVANSSESMTQLRGPFKWLSKGTLFASNLGSLARSALKYLEKSPEYTDEVASFLQEIDVPVTRIRFDTEEQPELNTDLGGIDGGLASMRAASQKQPAKLSKLTHQTALGEADFSFEEESDGTRNLFGFWLPWSLLTVDHDHPMRTLCVDELDSSLHPLIVSTLISRHINSGICGQLIFTTHDTHLMDTTLLRRDQFWLTERDANGATSIRSVHDFEGREGEDIEKRYYEGRYRSLPYVAKG